MSSNNYINATSGISRGPIKIQKDGVWLLSSEKTYKTGPESTNTETATVLEFFTIHNDGNTPVSNTQYGAEHQHKDHPVLLQTPLMNTGFHTETIDGKAVEVPNVGDLTIPNIGWVRAYCSDLRDGNGNTIDISLFLTVEQFKKELDNFNKNTVQPISTKLDETREICDNLSRWKDEDLWILDGGSPSHTIR